MGGDHEMTEDAKRHAALDEPDDVSVITEHCRLTCPRGYLSNSP